MQTKNKFGVSASSLVAYDYQYLLQSIPRYIEYVDEVILGLDADRKTWAGNDFHIPAQFFDELKSIDPDRKVKIVEESFYVPNTPTMELDTRERNKLSEHCIEGNWIVSIDADELLLNPKEFFASLSSFADDVCVFASWLVMYKRLSQGALIVSSKIDGNLEIFPIATKKRSSFVSARFTDQKREKSCALAMHYTWGRSEEELKVKLRNWSHNQDFDATSYLNLWNAIDEKNYKCLKDLHPLMPNEWPELIYIPESEIEQIKAENLLPVRAAELSSVRKFIKAFTRKHLGLSLGRGL